MSIPKKPAYARDAQGRATFRDSFVLYLDLLGTSALAKGSSAATVLVAMDDALREARQYAGREGYDEYWFATAWFSDNLAIGCPYEDDGESELGMLLDAVGLVQLTLAGRGFFSRGGTAVGEYFMDDGIAFGAPLVEAVALEKMASVPCVLLSKQLVELCTVHLGYYGESGGPINSELMVDDADRVFVNYLGALRNYVDESLDEVTGLVSWHADAVQGCLCLHEQDPRLEPKYRWLAEYHNEFCRRNGLTAESIPLTSTSRHEFREFKNLVR